MSQKKHLLVFLFIFGGIITLAGLKLINDAKENLYWPTAEGVITQSFINWDKDRRRYADIKYSFVVNGETITGFQISSKEMNTSSEELLKEYPVGKKVTVYYDPDDPYNCYLEPGYSWQSYQAFVIGIIILLVAIGVAILYKEKPQNKEHEVIKKV